MKRVSVESSAALSNLSRSIGDVEAEMRDNLDRLNGAFAVACESWKDKNAKICGDTLAKHNAVMRKALGKLENFETALRRLSSLTQQYENI